MKRIILILIAGMALGVSASAQNWAVSTNMADFVSLGTLNAEFSAGVGRRVTVEASASTINAAIRPTDRKSVV